MFPTSTLQKNDHSIPLLTILTTCNPSHPTHLLESKWLHWASQKMINGEQSLCWLWFIHHVSQEVKPRGAAMSEETPHVATRKEEATNMASPYLLSFRIQHCQVSSPCTQHLSPLTALIWGSQSDTCSRWTATAALESGHYYSLLAERLYLLLKDTQISHNSIEK